MWAGCGNFPTANARGRRAFKRVCARTDEGTGEVDLDRDDYERIETHKRQGHGEVLDRLFKRPLDKSFKKFVG